MPEYLHELIEHGGADGPVGEEAALRTLSGFYALIEADSNLADDKKEMLAEIVSGAYTKILKSRRSVIVSAAMPFYETLYDDAPGSERTRQR